MNPESEGLIQLRKRTDPPAVVNAGKSVALGQLVGDISALETIVGGWDEQQRSVVRALQNAIDALHKEAFVRLIRALRADPTVAVILREVASDEVVYGVLRHHEILRASLQERVELALESVRPFLASHGGSVELVEVLPPDAVTVRLLGSCDGCAASGLTLRAGVEKAVKERCPEIKSVKNAGGGERQGARAHFVSPFARADDAGWIRVARLDELPLNGIKAVEAAGRSLLLARFEVGVSCFDNACAHNGMPLDMGEVDDGTLVCPHHGFRYALESGACLTAPGVQLHVHAVRVAGDEVEVKLT